MTDILISAISVFEHGANYNDILRDLVVCVHLHMQSLERLSVVAP